MTDSAEEPSAQDLHTCPNEIQIPSIVKDYACSFWFPHARFYNKGHYWRYRKMWRSGKLSAKAMVESKSTFGVLCEFRNNIEHFLKNPGKVFGQVLVVADHQFPVVTNLILALNIPLSSCEQTYRATNIWNSAPWTFRLRCWIPKSNRHARVSDLFCWCLLEVIAQQPVSKLINFERNYHWANILTILYPLW